MWLSKAANSLNRIVHPVSRVLHSVGVGVLAVLMLLTAADVTLRYVFNRPIEGSFELTQYMLAIVVAFGLAYCAVMKGNVRVEVVTSHLPQRAQAIINNITSLLGVGLFFLITWQSFMQMKLVLGRNLTSGVLLIPTFPFVAVVAFSSALLTIVLLADFLGNLSQAVRK